MLQTFASHSASTVSSYKPKQTLWFMYTPASEAGETIISLRNKYLAHRVEFLESQALKMLHERNQSHLVNNVYVSHEPRQANLCL